jgi:hypothetical protein
MRKPLDLAFHDREGGMGPFGFFRSGMHNLFYFVKK